jgi:prepilin-type N-terminal cleavage/methylation domain-containing protein
MENQGFTLIELIIAITILIVISAIAIPGVVDYQAYQNEEQFVNQTISSLKSLQLKALVSDNFTNFSLASSGISLCEGISSTNCENLVSTVTIFPANTNTLNSNFYFDKFANTRKNTTALIDQNEIELETKYFKIVITKFGGIYKEKKKN